MLQPLLQCALVKGRVKGAIILNHKKWQWVELAMGTPDDVLPNEKM
eukprot:CAMPEP_0172763884 /NCGR_PEP_ID=MMETSP1074-20121228/176243_1 /TAXON_ID=2916 /ORGANISM="Ceratium fusus, Strain PA161109" /LENGTH=45 /DNA_ID= /DNA_START= /DNA_END= /DNA_ORIENTATION=